MVLSNAMMMGLSSASTGGGYNFFNGGVGNSYLSSSSLSGVSDGFTGSMSLWVKVQTNATNALFLTNGGAAIEIFLNNIGRMFMELSDGSSFLASQQTSTPVTINAWNNFLISWNTNHTAGNKVLNIYMNGANVNTGTVDSSGAFQTTYASVPTVVPSVGTSANEIDMAQIWFAPNQFIDFSNPANVALFYNSGLPVSLGSNGQIPTGTAPAVYLKNPAASAGTNSGTGGNFTINGTILPTAFP